MRPFALCVLAVALVAGCGKKPEPGALTPDAPSAPGPVVAAEVAPFQGAWSVVKLELSPGGNSPEISTVNDADRQKIAVTVTGKLVKLDLPIYSESWIKYFVVAPNTGKSPHELDLIDSDETATTGPRSMTTKGGTMDVPRERHTGLYKFEGDTLIIALPLDTGMERPTGFKPELIGTEGGRKVPVAVAHLKKK